MPEQKLLCPMWLTGGGKRGGAEIMRHFHRVTSFSPMHPALHLLNHCFVRCWMLDPHLTASLSPCNGKGQQSTSMDKSPAFPPSTFAKQRENRSPRRLSMQSQIGRLRFIMSMLSTWLQMDWLSSTVQLVLEPIQVHLSDNSVLARVTPA